MPFLYLSIRYYMNTLLATLGSISPLLADVESSLGQRARDLYDHAREQDLFVTTGIEPVDVDVGISDKAAHLTQRSEEDFFEPSFGCHLAQRSIDVRLRNDEAERLIERLGFCGGLKHSFRLVELGLIDANVLVPNGRSRHLTFQP